MFFQCATVILAIFILPIITSSDEVKYEVIGPVGPVAVLAGNDVILPCYLEPNISAVDMKVEWIRPDKSFATVHLYENQKDRDEAQSVSYTGRTSLFKEELRRGNTSLHLTKVKVSDGGKYKCSVQTPTWLEEADLEVSVKGAGSIPVVTIGEPKDTGLNLMCESSGWHPEPEMLWLDSKGHNLLSVHTVSNRDAEGLYTVTGHVVVYSDGNNTFICRVQQKLINYITETEIPISGDLFPKSPYTAIGIGVAVVFLLLLTGFILVNIFWHIKKKQQSQGWTRGMSVSKRLLDTSEAVVDSAVSDISPASMELKEIGSTSDCMDRKLTSQNEAHTKDRPVEKKISFVLEVAKEHANPVAKEHAIQLDCLKKQLDFVNRRKYQEPDIVIQHQMPGITFNQETAHYSLTVSGETISYKVSTRKHAAGEKTVQFNSTERFKRLPCVLANEPIATGNEPIPKRKSYFAVEVTGSWIIGVVKKSINREKKLEFGTKDGAWTLRCRNGKIGVYTDTLVSLPCIGKSNVLNIVGVFVDCEKHIVSFYNMTKSHAPYHIYSYEKCDFPEEPLYPFFGISTELRIINPVHAQRGDVLSVPSLDVLSENPEDVNTDGPEYVRSEASLDVLSEVSVDVFFREDHEDALREDPENVMPEHLEDVLSEASLDVLSEDSVDVLTGEPVNVCSRDSVDVAERTSTC